MQPLNNPNDLPDDPRTVPSRKTNIHQSPPAPVASDPTHPPPPRGDVGAQGTRRLRAGQTLGPKSKAQPAAYPDNSLDLERVTDKLHTEPAGSVTLSGATVGASSKTPTKLQKKSETESVESSSSSHDDDDDGDDDDGGGQ